MEVDIGQQRRDDSTLRRTFVFDRYRAVLIHPGLEEAFHYRYF